MDNPCPSCDKTLSYEDGSYYCENCEQRFSKHAFCNICNAELEKLNACGAVSYFCNQCNELKSKSQVSYQFNLKA